MRVCVIFRDPWFLVVVRRYRRGLRDHEKTEFLLWFTIWVVTDRRHALAEFLAPVEVGLWARGRTLGHVMRWRCMLLPRGDSSGKGNLISRLPGFILDTLQRVDGMFWSYFEEDHPCQMVGPFLPRGNFLPPQKLVFFFVSRTFSSLEDCRRKGFLSNEIPRSLKGLGGVRDDEIEASGNGEGVHWFEGGVPCDVLFAQM
ncbi:hypothetical protein CEXT_662351 [Caerostris extrusa]|uniref:Uncharacterized protein n=1 Tax=Caerostris extrusa TaxID=172846 RepID=A0AAV4NBU9_CAEEX|nr:hypothetical protein CEXT_662351 [Caerostris extrusa]